MTWSKIKRTAQLLFFLLVFSHCKAQIDVTSGTIYEEVTTAERNLIPLGPNDKAIVNNITTNQLEYWDGTQWVAFGSGSGGSDGYISNVALVANALSFTGVLSGFSGSVDLSPFLDNTDDQTATEVPVSPAVNALTNVQAVLEDHEARIDGLAAGGADGVVSNVALAGTNLNFTGSGGGFNGTVPLASLQDGTGTDSQTLSFTSPNLSISGGNIVNLSALQDGTGTDDQVAAEVPVSSVPTNYTAAGQNVESHLIGINTALGGIPDIVTESASNRGFLLTAAAAGVSDIKINPEININNGGTSLIMTRTGQPYDLHLSPEAIYLSSVGDVNRLAISNRYGIDATERVGIRPFSHWDSGVLEYDWGPDNRWEIQGSPIITQANASSLGVGGDNLGNHTATTELDMAGNNIANASGLQVNGSISVGAAEFGGDVNVSSGNLRLTSASNTKLRLSYFPTAHPEGRTGDLYVDKETGNLYWDSFFAGTNPIQLDGGGGGGGISVTGTPVDNQLAVWTGASSIEGQPNLTFDGNTLQMSRTTGGNFDKALNLFSTNMADAGAQQWLQITFGQSATTNNAAEFSYVQSPYATAGARMFSLGMYNNQFIEMMNTGTTDYVNFNVNDIGVQKSPLIQDHQLLFKKHPLSTTNGTGSIIVGADADGSTDSAPAIFGIANMNSGNESGRVQFGDAYNAFGSTFNAGMYARSYHPMYFFGGRSNTTALTAADYPSNAAAAYVFNITGDKTFELRTNTASPVNPMFEVFNSAGTSVSTISHTGAVTANSFVKSGATSDDVLLGDGTTTSLAAIGGGGTDSQTLSIGGTLGNDLTISNGNTVTIPNIESSNMAIPAQTIRLLSTGLNSELRIGDSSGRTYFGVQSDQFSSQSAGRGEIGEGIFFVENAGGTTNEMTFTFDFDSGTDALLVATPTDLTYAGTSLLSGGGGGGIDSDITGLTGASVVTNIVKGTEANIDGWTADATRLDICTDCAPASTSTGTAINLGGYYQYNMASASAATTYTLTNQKPGGYAECLVNASSEPSVTGATKMANTADFAASTNMIMCVKAFGTTYKYWFKTL